MNLERAGLDGELDICLIHTTRHSDAGMGRDKTRHFWVGSVKRTAASFLRLAPRGTHVGMTPIQADIQRIQGFLAPLTVGDARQRAYFDPQSRGAVNYLVMTRRFTLEDRNQIVQHLAKTLYSIPDHGIDQVYTMDMADVISQRRPQPLTLPDPDLTKT